MTASLRRTVIVVMAAVVVATTLVLAASIGPSAVISERDGSASVVDQAETRPTPPTDEEAAEDGDPQPLRGEDTSDAGDWARDLVTFALLAAGLWVLALALRAVGQALGRRLPEQQLVLELDPRPDLEGARDSLNRDQDRLEEALASADVRNGIVACWVLLEEAAAAAGVVRAPAETATEFVVRFLHFLDVDPRPVADLAHLFHEARFSTHDLGPDARPRAAAALAAIHRDLQRSPARG